MHTYQILKTTNTGAELWNTIVAGGNTIIDGGNTIIATGYTTNPGGNTVTAGEEYSNHNPGYFPLLLIHLLTCAVQTIHTRSNTHLSH